MDNLTNNEFIEFIESFQDFYENISEISKSHNKNPKPLINSDFKMYSLDDMAKESKSLIKNLPKTTDAIYFKLNEDNLVLYIIEFKFHDLDKPNAKDLLTTLVVDIEENWNEKKFRCLSYNTKKNLKKINKYYADDVELKLILKPVETMTIVIPYLYEEFCIKNNLKPKDIRKYLETIEKNLIVFVSSFDDSKKHCFTKQRQQSMGTNLEKYYNRLKSACIISDYSIYPAENFDFFLKSEGLNV